MNPWLVYDCEIVNAISKNGEARIEGINYCAGWRDFPHMGISVICAYDYRHERYRVFCRDNFDEFSALAAERNLVSFNGLAFDDQLCAANGIAVRTHYDILVEVWRAAGLAPEFRCPTHLGYGLDALAKANHVGGKTGHGVLAPVQWQRGEIGAVIDYCLEDVRLTKLLLDQIILTGKLTSPVEARVLRLRSPVSGAQA